MSSSVPQTGFDEEQTIIWGMWDPVVQLQEQNSKGNVSTFPSFLGSKLGDFFVGASALSKLRLWLIARILCLTEGTAGQASLLCSAVSQS